MDERARAEIDTEPVEVDPTLRRRNVRRRRPRPWMAAALVALAVGACAWLATAHKWSSSGGTFEVLGGLVLTNNAFIDTAGQFDRDPCQATGGYTDISAGTAVVIGGPTGQVAVGALDGGTMNSGECVFSFDVSAVPVGLSVYTVTISHRATKAYTPDEIRAPIRLTLGD
jgi:hypothetical protein